jgi:hypothetical protein
MQIGSQKQLLIDDYVVERLEGVQQRLHPAIKDVANPILAPDHPDQDMFLVGFGNVLYDDEEHIYKMWYLRWDRLWNCEDTHYRYAISQDGLSWEQPALGLVEFNGTRENNVILRGPTALRMVDGGNVIKDHHDPDPTRRYKMLNWSANERGEQGVCVFFSPDGVHWSANPTNPVIHDPTWQTIGDTHNVIGWDESRGCYVGLLRPGGLPRRIGRSESKDFVHWPLPETVMAPDEQDPPETQFYCMPTLLYEGIYIGMVYHLANSGGGTPYNADNAGADTMQIQLATSRDTIHWERRFRTPFIPVGPAGSFDCGMIFAAHPIVAGDEIRIYYGGFNVLHSVPQPNERAAIGLARVRLDGFVSVDGGPSGGSLVTKAFHFTGTQLEVNADASEGQVVIEILDEAERPIPGFSQGQAIPLRGDHLRYQVRWQGEGSLGALQERPVRLHFHLSNASLYAFQFRMD